jgi:hypothetical protein
MEKLKTSELLGNFGRILEELRRRGICRSENIPTGDLAEYLSCKALGLTLADNSTKGYDAIDPEGKKYQIKGRRITSRNKSRQLSAIREIEDGHFDYILAVFFDAEFGIHFAYRFTASACKTHAKFISRTNSYKLFANESIIQDCETKDYTDLFRKTLQGA